jgi:ribosomal protein S18 acetylase RimI-like enzyme
MKKEIEVRPANDGDCGRIIELLAQIGEHHHNGRPDVFKSGISKYTLEELREILKNPEKPVFAAVNADGFLTGYVFCQLTKYKNHAVFDDFNSLYIDDFCVDEQFRNQGIGTLLFEKCKEFAEEHDCRFLDLNVWVFNESAVRFYEKCGFKTRSVRMEYNLTENEK